MLQSASLAALPGIRHAFFTRAGGVSKGCYESLNGGVGSDDLPAHVAQNRARMAASVGVAAQRLITAYQVHSPTVVTAVEPWDVDARPKADAIVTRVAGLAIAVSTADCGPILLADQAAGVIGATHAGWRGALAGVAEATIAAMEACGAERTRIVAALGPMIRQANYEVGPEFVTQFMRDDDTNARFFHP
jgi:YfiH family protein